MDPGLSSGPVTAGVRPASGSLHLLIAPHPAVDRLMDELAVRLARAGAVAETGGLGRPAPAGINDPGYSQTCRTLPVSPRSYLYILDGGNRFDLHGIARGLARGTYAGGTYAGGISAGGSAQVEALLPRIQVARAFTCYQVEAMLAREAVGGPSLPQVSEPAGGCGTPVLAPGLLTTFADENVPHNERLRLLGRCIQHLKRLARYAPVVVSAASAHDAEAAGFLARLESAADQVWRFEALAARTGRRAPAVASGQLRLF